MPDSTQAQPIQPFIPPGLPSGLAGLIGQPDQQGQQSTPPLSQTSPTAPSAAPPPAAGGAPSSGDIGEQMGMTRQDIAERLAKVRGLESKVEPIVEKKAALQMPPTGFTPTWHHGEGGLGILKNLGQALELGLGATKPGQAIQQAYYGPALRQYTGQQQAMAQQISELQKQEEEARGTLSPLQSMAYHYGTVGVQQERNQINAQRVQAYGQNVANRHWADIQRIIQGDKRLGLEQTGQALKMKIAEMNNEVRREAIAAGMDENAATNAVRENLGNLIQQGNMTKEHPWLSSFLPDWLPGVPQTPGGAAPVAAPPTGQQPSAAKPAPKPGMQYARDEKGVLHQAKAGTPLPKGWKPEKGPGK